MEFKRNIRAMLQASRPKDTPTCMSDTSVVLKPSPAMIKAAAAAAVIEAVARAADEASEYAESGPPDDPGKIFDAIHNWNRDVDGEAYWKKARQHWVSFFSRYTGAWELRRVMWILAGTVSLSVLPRSSFSAMADASTILPITAVKFQAVVNFVASTLRT